MPAVSRPTPGLAPQPPSENRRERTTGKNRRYHRTRIHEDSNAMSETSPPPISTIKLLCNMNRSNAATLSILNSGSDKVTAILLQKQRLWSEQLKSSLIHDTSWTLIKPTTKEQRPRWAIYINNRLLASPFYEQKHFPFNDVTAVVVIRTTNPKPTLIIDIYNPPGQDSIITPLRHSLRRNI
jgi:hypothetical protein